MALLDVTPAFEARQAVLNQRKAERRSKLCLVVNIEIVVVKGKINNLISNLIETSALQPDQK